ncbi:flavin-containing monooxygenase [Nocardioides sp. URHA0032]|uniref:flavin-containing monooxygenase n=1 Tax=Nocardioides sp. URHA0032 TaxID=1380388 RepID=UPI00048D7A99|nr:NAD(P)/FAD-dependent oxidoreductase [Nocardioides sp. URHA0032]
MHVEHLIVGAGFAGLCAAIKLQEDGETDFLVVEKGSDVGGTWRDNTYPGAACDVPSQLYSYSFATNPEWSMSYSPQPEIQAYLRSVAESSGTLDRFEFDTRFEDATWDEAAQVWRSRITGPDGERTVVSRTLVVGAGSLSEPKLPEIEGIETFQGELFHSARWNHDVDLAGKRVAVIGTGASAIQIVPELQQSLAASGGHLDVYQRTAPWVIPRNDRRYGALERRALRRLPLLRKVYRTGIYWAHEAYVPAFTIEPKIAAPAKQAALANIRKGIKDPALRERVTPHFEIGCKRILRSNTWYPALAADNTELVTDPIAKVTGNAVVTADGVERPVDVLVVATGFHTTDLPFAEQVTGTAGRSLADVWREQGMAAYKGTTVPGFPNLFVLVGPNTGQGHTSMVFIIEAQVAYLRDAVRTMRERGLGAIEPREAAHRKWNRSVQRRMKRTVWTTGGCESWYLDEHGRNTTLWPKATFTFRRNLARFDADAYDTTPVPTSREEQPA